MRTQLFSRSLLLVFIISAAVNVTHAQTSKETTMIHATGTFEVKMTPQAADADQDVSLGRMLISKQIHGDIEGTSQGQMLTAGTAVKGSAGYVAIEKITGKLNGRSGSFMLQHSGTMTQGAPHLVITVVPDSGTDQLVGITGTMNIDKTDGKHSYQFDYSLPAQSDGAGSKQK
jgi:hypothetical protein